jgi:hypothetical protein
MKNGEKTKLFRFWEFFDIVSRQYSVNLSLINKIE